MELSSKYLKIWKRCRPLLKKGRLGDFEHAEEVIKVILNYKGKLKLDYEILIPVAMMHDIGHSAILPEHFKYVTGPEKITNGKLVHMLTGAKIADDILKSVGYENKKRKEIVDMISVHDYDQLKTGEDLKKIYNTENKRIFHDIDSLDRYNEKRIKNIKKIYPNEKELLTVLKNMLKLFFYKEFKEIAKEWIDKKYSSENGN